MKVKSKAKEKQILIEVVLLFFRNRQRLFGAYSSDLDKSDSTLFHSQKYLANHTQQDLVCDYSVSFLFDFLSMIIRFGHLKQKLENIIPSQEL